MFRRVSHNAGVIWRTYVRWQDDDGPLMSAAVAYYLGLSIFPLLVTLIAGVGMFFRYTRMGQDAEQQVLHLLAEQASPQLEAQVRELLAHLQDRSNLGGSLGLIGVLIAAIAGFTQFERAFDHIWNVPPPEDKGIVAGIRHTLMERGVAFLMLLFSGLVVIAVFIADVLIASFEGFLVHQLGLPSVPGPLIRFLASLTINTLLFTLLFKMLTPKKIRFLDALRAGMFTGCGWEVGRIVVGAFIIGTKYTDAYGVIGSFVAVLLWAYYAIAIVFLGAEYLKETTTAEKTDTSLPAARSDSWPPPVEACDTSTEETHNGVLTHHHESHPPREAALAGRD